ncbi:MAG TPA: tRNA pseudouridine(38-40) synthase TruA [Phycisphaerales bacterium]|nr:tRNA pseudouridine(38-40) synthase TruA [Phycisphaerales bacterium]
MPRRNIKLTIQYDGSAYHGWQVQPDVATVEAHISGAIEKLFGKEVCVNGASRTDAGVSALCQVVSIKVDTPVPTENMAKALTGMLPDDIAVVEAVEVENDKWNAISSPSVKLYRYTINTAKTPPVLDIRHCWHFPKALDVEAMSKAAALLVGEKDFKSFATASDERKSSVRTVKSCCVTADGEHVYVEVSANGFLYNMVRNIVGTLVEIGRGRWGYEVIEEILEAKDRSAAGPIAPAAGLCLMSIEYEDLK